MLNIKNIVIILNKIVIEKIDVFMKILDDNKVGFLIEDYIFLNIMDNKFYFDFIEGKWIVLLFFW